MGDDVQEVGAQAAGEAPDCATAHYASGRRSLAPRLQVGTYLAPKRIGGALGELFLEVFELDWRIHRALCLLVVCLFVLGLLGSLLCT